MSRTPRRARSRRVAFAWLVVAVLVTGASVAIANRSGDVHSSGETKATTARNASPDPATTTPRPSTTAKQPPIESIDLVVSDQQGTHEGKLPLSPLVDWSRGPLVQAGNDATGMHAAVTWGVLFLDGNPQDADLDPGKGNTRVEIRNIQTWLLSKSTGKWVLVSSGAEHGEAYHEDFDGNASSPMDVRDDAEGMSGKLDFSHGRNAWHFWDPRGSIDPSDVAGMFGRFDARLVLDDPNGPDDRAFWSTRLLLGAGIDYWRSPGAEWPDNSGASIGKFKFVTGYWRAFNTSTLSEAELRGNPPPLG